MLGISPHPVINVCFSRHQKTSQKIFLSIHWRGLCGNFKFQIALVFLFFVSCFYPCFAPERLKTTHLESVRASSMLQAKSLMPAQAIFNTKDWWEPNLLSKMNWLLAFAIVPAGDSVARLWTWILLFFLKKLIYSSC